MKVTLFALNSSYSHTNLAVRALGVSLRQHGIPVTMIEKNRKDAHAGVLHALYAENADVYGFSTYIWNVEDILRFAAELKVIRPQAAIVLGGPEVSFAEENFFDTYPFVDYVIAGEGEDALAALCLSLAAGEKPPRLCRAELFSAFETSGIDYDVFGDEPHGLVYYESVRGCPFSCAYCLSSVSHGVRAKSAEKALADLLLFEQFHDVRTVKLVDRTFNFDRERAKVIWRGLLSPSYTKEYHFEVSAALLDAESFALLRQAPKGKFRLEVGVQSTNSATIREVSRALDTGKTLAALDELTQAGNLHVHADLIAGLPHEDFASFGRSFDDVYGRCNVLQLGFLKLLRGSALHRDAARYGIRYSPAPPYQVLQTEALPYEHLARLEKIEAVLERYGNSGKFSYSFPFLPCQSGSAFAFFDRFAAFLAACGVDDLSKLPQAEAFLKLLSFVGTAFPALREETKERLALDFLLGETRRLPKPLSEIAAGREERERALLSVPAADRAGTEVVHLSFLGKEPILVNRLNKTVTVLTV